MTMKKVNIVEVKARLSELLELAESGERVVICRRNQPVAELRPLSGPRVGERPLGGMHVAVPDSFFTPLPAEVEDSFYSTASGGASAVAERSRSSFGETPKRRQKKR
jgi:antitoxin (DNA-binding transcriptional repressor) of toxin-antitoxin stability system